VVLVDGEPVDQLLDQSAAAELLVVGRHGTSGLVHSALGGVGDTCARLATCPVVIVPS
jgi:nucleotide-binding universal stress UspA family protein